jgi:hypothetical protein
MSAQCVLRHQLGRDLIGQRSVQPAPDIDGGQFGVFVDCVGRQFFPLSLQIRILRIGLRTDGDILACGHRHRARHHAGNAGNQNTAAAGLGRGHTDDQTGRGDDPVVGAEDRGTEPADAVSAVAFGVSHSRYHAEAPNGESESATSRAYAVGCIMATE